jgi:hypothetical protein
MHSMTAANPPIGQLMDIRPLLAEIRAETQGICDNGAAIQTDLQVLSVRVNNQQIMGNNHRFLSSDQHGRSTFPLKQVCVCLSKYNTFLNATGLGAK